MMTTPNRMSPTMRPALAKGDLALIAGQPLAPPVRVTRIEELPWGWRCHFQHEARGYGHSPQSSDLAGYLVPVPTAYTPPPASAEFGEGYSAAALGWLDEHRGWLVIAHGAERIARARRYLARRLGDDAARPA